MGHYVTLDHKPSVINYTDIKICVTDHVNNGNIKKYKCSSTVARLCDGSFYVVFLLRQIHRRKWEETC